MLCGFSEKFSSLSIEAQNTQVAKLLHVHQASSAPTAAPAVDAPAAPSSAPSQPTPAADARTDQCSRIPLNSAADRQSGKAESTPETEATRSLESQELDILASMCPSSVPEGFLKDLLYRHHKGNLEAAADALLTSAETEQLGAEVAAWAAQQAHRPTPAAQAPSEFSGLELDDELRRSIVARYHLQAVPSSDSNARKKEGVSAWGGGGTEGGGRRQARFRDGVVVSTKGEKYIVEKPPEWDGGSRGKVKSKRKGGVGWH